MVSLQRSRRRKRWKEKLCRSRGIIRPWSPASTGTDAASCASPDAGANPASRSRPGASGPRTASPGAGTLNSGAGSRHRRCNRLKERFWIRHRCWFWRRNHGRWRRSNDRRSIGRRCAKLYVLKSLPRRSIRAAGRCRLHLRRDPVRRRRLSAHPRNCSAPPDRARESE